MSGVRGGGHGFNCKLEALCPSGLFSFWGLFVSLLWALQCLLGKASALSADHRTDVLDLTQGLTLAGGPLPASAALP